MLLPGVIGEIELYWDQQRSAVADLRVGARVVVVHPGALLRRGSWRVATLGVLEATRTEKGVLVEARVRAVDRARIRRIVRRAPHLVLEVMTATATETLTPSDRDTVSRAAAALRTRRHGPTGPSAREWERLRDPVRIDSICVAHGGHHGLLDASALDVLCAPSLRARLRALREWPPTVRLFEEAEAPDAATRRDTDSEAGDDDNPSDVRERATLPEHIETALAADYSDSSWDAPGRHTRRLLERICWTPSEVQPLDLATARALLDRSHAGLEDVKQAVLDELAVHEWQRRRGAAANSPPPLCLVGPPGVGKTSIAAAIAAATGRRLERINIAGADDVYLQGADRSYRRAEPGEIAMRLYRSRRHPAELLFFLDEVDKVSPHESRSPVASLLCLLDSEQNQEWQDVYLSGIPLDLSAAWFIATANDDERIPAPLRDRLRFLRLPAYPRSAQERIAHTHLLPRLLEELRADGVVTVSDAAVSALVWSYPAAPGMRGIDQRLRAALARALRQHLETSGHVDIDREWLDANMPREGSGRRSLGFRGRYNARDEEPTPSRAADESQSSPTAPSTERRLMPNP